MLLTIEEAAKALKVSRRHIDRLIAEADSCPKKARWKNGRDFIDLTPFSSTKRVIRIVAQPSWQSDPDSD